MSEKGYYHLKRFNPQQIRRMNCHLSRCLSRCSPDTLRMLQQHESKHHLHCISSSPFPCSTLILHQPCCYVTRHIRHFSPQNLVASWLRQLRSRCCSGGGSSPKFSSPPGALLLPHPGCYPKGENKAPGTCIQAGPSLVAVEGHPGKGHCILLRHRATGLANSIAK